MSKGWRQDYQAFLTDIHQPVGSAAEVLETRDDILWHDRGSLLAGDGLAGVNLRREYWSLKQIHRDCHGASLCSLCQPEQLWSFLLEMPSCLRETFFYFFFVVEFGTSSTSTSGSKTFNASSESFRT